MRYSEGLVGGCRLDRHPKLFLKPFTSLVRRWYGTCLYAIQSLSYLVARKGERYFVSPGVCCIPHIRYQRVCTILHTVSRYTLLPAVRTLKNTERQFRTHMLRPWLSLGCSTQAGGEISAGEGEDSDDEKYKRDRDRDRRRRGRDDYRGSRSLSRERTGDRGRWALPLQRHLFSCTYTL